MCQDCDRLTDELEAMQDEIECIADFCQRAIEKADAEALSHASGIPRGQWAYWLGVSKIASEVLNYVS